MGTVQSSKAAPNELGAARPSSDEPCIQAFSLCPTHTRRELYDLVWSTPMIKLAVRFGVSNFELKKICDRHQVPTPPPGHWSKLGAGYKPEQTPLPEVSDVRLDRIEIGSHGVALPKPVRRVIEAQKLERIRAAEPPRQLEPNTNEPIVDVHPAVRRTIQVLHRCKPSEPAVHAIGEGLCGVSVGRDSVERAVFVLGRLAYLLAGKGTPLAPTGQAMKVTVGSDSAILALSERTRTIAHAPTAGELAEEGRRQEQLERHWRNPARWPRPPYGRGYPEKDTVWTGELSIRIEGYSDGVRRTWADGRTQRLEDLVPSVVDGIEVLLAARKAKREACEEQARQWAELARRRKLAQARQEREKARLTFFDGLVALRRGADDLRRALTEIGSGLPAPGGSQVTRMMAWGETQLRQMEEQLQADRIEGRLTEAKLFPGEGEDELHDPLGELPVPRWPY